MFGCGVGQILRLPHIHSFPPTTVLWHLLASCLKQVFAYKLLFMNFQLFSHTLRFTLKYKRIVRLFLKHTFNYMQVC